MWVTSIEQQILTSLQGNESAKSKVKSITNLSVVSTQKTLFAAIFLRGAAMLFIHFLFIRCMRLLEFENNYVLEHCSAFITHQYVALP